MDKCQNVNCSKTIPKCIREKILYQCAKCSKSFCCEQCIKTHQMTTHIKKETRNSGYKSLFLKQGQILSFPSNDFNLLNKNDPYFNYLNFELIRTANNKNLQMLGTGAFGNVYLAKNKTDSKLYAIKHVRKSNVFESGASIDIMYREINIQLKLKHDNIVRLFSAREDEENFYLIMEYLNNGSLFSYIKKQKRLNEEEAFNFFIQAANSVYFLHSIGYIHRDIKPENLLLDKDGNVKLCDFGWCVNINEGQRKTFCGTYEYMAPEIINDESYDQSIDVWSLGVLLYEMTHGYSPFRANNHGEEEYKEIFRNILKMNYTIDEQLGLSVECADMIHKLLESEMSKRMKVIEIFRHPWVRKREVEKKKERIKKSEEEYVQERINVNQKEVIYENSKKDKDKNEKEKEKEFDDVLMQMEMLNGKKKKKKIKTNQEQKEQKEKKEKQITFNIPKEKKSNFSFNCMNNKFRVNQLKNKNKALQKKERIKDQIEKNNKNDSSIFNMENENQDFTTSFVDLDQTEMSFFKEVKLTAASTKRSREPSRIIPSKLFLNESSLKEPTSNDMINIIQILDYSRKVNEEDPSKKPQKEQSNDSIWDKILKPFQCGNN